MAPVTACRRGPYGYVTPEKIPGDIDKIWVETMKIQSARDLESGKKRSYKDSAERPRIGVGTSSCGIAVGGMALYERMKKIIQDRIPRHLSCKDRLYRLL